MATAVPLVYSKFQNPTIDGAREYINQLYDYTNTFFIYLIIAVIANCSGLPLVNVKLISISCFQKL